MCSAFALRQTNKSHELNRDANELNRKSLETNRQALKLTREMFKRQGVFDLHEIWEDVSDINCEDLITDDVITAVNALNLTASLWNHDIVDKDILYDYYWSDYKQL